MGHFAAIDLGTTYFKAGLFNEDGELLAVAHATPPLDRPSPGCWELQTAGFDGAIRSLLADLADRSPDGLGGVEAISFATQANSFVLLDQHDAPLTPLILWPDDRAASLMPELDWLVSHPELFKLTGCSVVFAQMAVAKIRWLTHHHPELIGRAKRLCLISDYLTLRLTGHHASEAGAAGLTGAVDIHRLQWWGPTGARLGLNPSWLAPIVRAGTDLGPLRDRAADELGLPRTCRFVVGCLDQFAGAVGAGNVEPGGVSETTGTVLATIRCTDRYPDDPRPGLFVGPAYSQGLYNEMAFGETSANILETYHAGLPDKPGFAALDALAADVAPGADGLRLRPGVDLTHPDDLFVHQSPGHGRGHAVRAILEAVAVALRQQVTGLCGNQMPAAIRSVGGAARSRLWRQIKADVLGVDVVATRCPEPTALGAAMLAAATTTGTALPDLARTWVRTDDPVHPDPTNRARYAELFQPAS